MYLEILTKRGIIVRRFQNDCLRILKTFGTMSIRGKKLIGKLQTFSKWTSLFFHIKSTKKNDSVKKSRGLIIDLMNSKRILCM